MLPAVGAIKVGAASPAHIHSRARMTAALPSLALALLCLLQAAAQVPLQPDLDTEKVNAQGAARHILPGLEGLAGAGGLCCTPRNLPSPFPSQFQGSFKGSLCKTRLVLDAVCSASSSPTARTPTCGAMMSPSVWHFPREHGPGAAPVLLAWGRTGCSACRKVAGPHVCLAGSQRGWQVYTVGHVPHSGGQIPTDGGRSLKRVTGPHRQWQVCCRLANFCTGLPGPPWRSAAPPVRSADLPQLFQIPLVMFCCSLQGCGMSQPSRPTAPSS